MKSKSFVLGLIFLIAENKSYDKADYRREEKEYAKLTDKVGNERLSRLFVEGQSYSVICDKVVEKVVDNKYNCRNYKLYERKFK